eukprot:jgi/Bigna1/66599/fgenesh1_pg.1_\
MKSRRSRYRTKGPSEESVAPENLPPPQPQPTPEEVKQKLEQVEQKITFTLRMIDSSLVNAQHVASKILNNVKTYATQTKSINESLQVWSKFFTSFPSVQAPSFTNSTHSTLGSSIHFGGTKTPIGGGDAGAGFTSTPVRKHSRVKEEKSIESLESLRHITPPLTTPFVVSDGNRKKMTAPYSCQRQLNQDMSMTSTNDAKEPEDEGAEFMSPVTNASQKLVHREEKWEHNLEDDDTNNGHRSFHVDSEIAFNVEDLSDSTPLASRVNNSIRSSEISGIADLKYHSTPKSGNALSKKALSDQEDQQEKENTTRAKELDLSQFPRIYQVSEILKRVRCELISFNVLTQHGLGASQLERVYMQFVTENMTVQKPQSIDNLAAKIKNFNSERLTLMVELLISRGFIKRIGKGSRSMYACNTLEKEEDILDISTD